MRFRDVRWRMAQGPWFPGRNRREAKAGARRSLCAPCPSDHARERRLREIANRIVAVLFGGHHA